MFLANTFKTQDMINVQLNTDLFNTKMWKLGSTLNKSTGFRLVESYFTQKLMVEGKKLSEFFTLSKVNIFKEQEITTENKDIVHCINLEELINHVLFEMEHLTDHLIKLGTDGGGSFLMSLVINTSKETDVRSSPCQKIPKLLKT